VEAARGRTGETVPADYFRRLYRKDADPWGFASSEYERSKYRATLAALPRLRYTSGLELGCSIGVFTAMLARRCASLRAVDCSPEAVRAAQLRCSSLAHVWVEECDLAKSFPRGRYDLVTICEIGYYFAPRDLARICDDIAAVLAQAGDLVLVHWTPPVEGHAQTADDVHATFINDERFAVAVSRRTQQYRLDVLSKK